MQPASLSTRATPGAHSAIGGGRHSYASAPSPTLPGAMQRSDVERLIRRVGPHIGMNDGTIAVLQIMISETRPSDWVDPTVDPVCYAMQTNIAVQVCKDERTVRRIEQKLEDDFHLIRKDTGLSGRRSVVTRRDGTRGYQGINFAPLITAVPDLLRLEAVLDADRIERRVIKQKISAGYSLIIEMLDRLETNADGRSEANTTGQGSLMPQCPIATAQKTFKAWPRRFPAKISTDALIAHLDAVYTLVESLEHIAAKHTKMSAQPDIYVRRIQDTNQDKLVLYQANTLENPSFDRPITGNPNFEESALHQPNRPEATTALGQPDRPPSSSTDSTRSNRNDQICLEQQSQNPDVTRQRAGQGAQHTETPEPNKTKPITRNKGTTRLDWLTPDVLYDLCSDEMKLQVTLNQGNRPHPEPRDFVIAAVDRLNPLDIHPTAYQDALDTMGAFRTALAILIIDRNVSHPVTPIRSPGGVLRAMTKRNRAGDLNLAQSLFGLKNRKQPLCTPRRGPYPRIRSGLCRILSDQSGSQ